LPRPEVSRVCSQRMWISSSSNKKEVLTTGLHLSFQRKPFGTFKKSFIIKSLKFVITRQGIDCRARTSAKTHDVIMQMIPRHISDNEWRIRSARRRVPSIKPIRIFIILYQQSVLLRNQVKETECFQFSSKLSQLCSIQIYVTGCILLLEFP
jgi:hypothetical protein